MGLLVPGDTISVITFKSVGSNILLQSLNVCYDMKLGQYLHIPPVAMICAMMYGCTLAAFVSVLTAWTMIFRLDFMIDLENGEWKATDFQTFVSQAAIWGAIAPIRFFEIYKTIMWCFLAGFCLPFIPWLLNKYVYPSNLWTLINCK